MTVFKNDSVGAAERGSALAQVQGALRARGAEQRTDADWCCPIKDNHVNGDRNASLTVRYGDQTPDKVLIHCAKCGGVDVLLPFLGLEPADLVDKPKSTVRRYVYTDEAGAPLFRVVKRPGENGKARVNQQRADGHGGWLSGPGAMQGVRRPLYRLDELAEAVGAGRTIHLTEGESDADALNAWFIRNKVNAFATCHPGGAGKWRPEHTDTLAGAARVVVWADRDGPGYTCAHHRLSAALAAGLRASARLPVEGKDVRDHLAAGHAPHEGKPVKEKKLAKLAGANAETATDTAEDEAPDDDAAIINRVAKLWLDERAKRQFRAEVTAERNARSRGSRQMDGAEFVLDLPPTVPVLWGYGSEALWVAGEALLLVGGDGVGKTTLAQQLVLRRLGVKDLLLDFPVEPADGRVLYLAMDRPDQARRSFARMLPPDFREEYRELLKKRLCIWRGPVPVDVLGSPDALANWIHETFGSDVSDVFVDSYKDIAAGLSEDAVGAGLNSAMQEVLARGMNWLGIHHQRKASGSNPDPTELQDVYGSRWLTAGVGSVLMLAGRAGERTVEIRHLKQPAGVVGPLLVKHDHVNGTTWLVDTTGEPFDVLDAAGADGVTVYDFALAMFGSVDDAARKRAARLLNRFVAKGDAVMKAAKRGGAGGSEPARYWLKKHAPAGV